MKTQTARQSKHKEREAKGKKEKRRFTRRHPGGLEMGLNREKTRRTTTRSQWRTARGGLATAGLVLLL